MKIYLAVMIVVALVVIALAIIFAVTQRKKRQTTNYRALFIIGISFLPVGIATKNPGIWIMGLIFLIISLVNRKEWQSEKKWTELSMSDKALRLTLMIVGFLLLVAGVALFFLKK